MTNRQKVLAINSGCRLGDVYVLGFCGLNHLQILEATENGGGIRLRLAKDRCEYLGSRVPFRGKDQTRLWT